MTSRSSNKFSRAMLLALLAATALLIAHSSRLVRSSLAEQGAAEPKTSINQGLSRAEISDRYGKLPLSFEVNKGQTDPQVKFLARGPGYDLFLTAEGAVLSLRKSPVSSLDSLRHPPSANAPVNTSAQPATVLQLKMIGANRQAVAAGQGEMPGKVNYFVGNDPANWHTNIPTYRQVNYKDVYPGVNMVYYGNQRQLEYDFVIAAGADPNVIKYRIDGANRIMLAKSGDLQLLVNDGTVTLHRPEIYQLASNGSRREVKGEYLIKGNEVGFKVRNFDSRKPLIIDPVLSYSTLLGTGSNEQGNSIAVDAQGNAYITGRTDSGIFPTTPGAFQTTASFGGAFVTKLDATGSNLIYSTYLSGFSTNGPTVGTGIAVDAVGDAYVTGYTSAADFPLVNPLRGGRNNLLITTDGGGNWTPNNVGTANRAIQALAIDQNSPSTIYAGTGFNGGIFKSTDGGANWTALNTGLTNPACPAIVIDPTSSNILYASLIPENFGSATGVYKSIDGGNTWTSSGLNGTQVSSLAIDPQNHLNVYAATTFGFSKSTNGGASWANANTGLNFGGATAIVIDPTTPATLYIAAGGGGVYKSTNSAGNWTQVNSGLTTTTVRALVMDPTAASTLYVGTSGGGVFKTTNAGTSWSAVNNGPSLSTGNMSSLAIVPTSTATVFAGTFDGRILKTTNAGGSWSTVYTTTNNTGIRALAIDTSSPAKVVAGVDSANLNLTSPDAFVTKLNSSGSALLYSTFVGGLLDDQAHAIAIDASGNAYIAGQTSSSDYPAVNAAQAAFAGPTGCTGDGFVTKLNSSGSALSFSTYLGGSGCDNARAIALDNAGNVYVAGETRSSNLATPGAFQTAYAGQPWTDAFAAKFTTAGALGYLTYLGGDRDDLGQGIATDSSGNAYVTGYTASSNFPTANAIQSTGSGPVNGDAFVTKVNPTGSALIYSTYLGGSNAEAGNGIAVDPGGNAYVAGYTGSIDFPLVAGALRTKSPLFKSFDGGNSWSNENLGITYGQINALAIDPTATAKLYAGTPLNNIRSVDGGRTWTSSITGLSLVAVTSIVVNPATPSTIYLSSVVFTNHGVFKSTDAGQSWNPANNGLNNAGAASIAIDPLTPSTLYTVADSALFKTVDNAGTWNKIGPQTFSFGLLVIDPVTPTTLYAARDGSGFNSGVIKSTDSGANWQAINNGLTSGYIYDLTLDPTTPTTLYAAAGSGGLFKSTNGGGSWATLSTTLQGPVAVDPSNPGTIYAVGNGNTGLFKSTDGGATWKAINNGLRSSSIRTIVVSPTNSSIVYVGTSLSTSDSDAFVTKLNPSGNAFVYSTLLGGSTSTSSNVANDSALAIALDPAGSAYVTGSTVTNDFPSGPNSYQPFNRGFTDAFVAKLGTSYMISGQVLDSTNAPVSGAQITLNDGSSLTQVVTDSDGYYQFSRLPEGGSFTVSASKPHVTMTPASQTFNNLSGNQTLNFVATATNAPFFTIGGQITNNGSGLSGVTVTLSGSQESLQTTDNNGNYSFTVAGGSDYTVTPSILAFGFTPPNQTFNNLSANQTANFAATRQNLVVTNSNDHGTGSLRQAMLDTNATPGLDTITFNLPGSGVQTINLLLGLPTITDPVIIDATTQPGYAGSPLIELNGLLAGSSAFGFQVTAGGSTIRGFAIGGFTSNIGIWLSGNGGNIIQGNYVGIDATGTVARRNNAGIQIVNGSSNNLIGGTTAAARNVISGNGFNGIFVGGSGNQIQGNFIGTNASGTAAITNGFEGVNISGSPQFTNNVIGGTAPGAGNLISGHQRGIYTTGPNTTIQGNLIGTDFTGTAAIPNYMGIQSTGASAQIGGTMAGARNVISGNGQGVYISGPGSQLQGNFIGTDITGTLALGNGSGGVFASDRALIGGTLPEARNVISGNGGLGNVVLDYNVPGDTVTVQGNYIGTDVTGNVALANPSAGIAVAGSRNVIGGPATGARNVISGNLVGIQLGGYSSSVTANVVQANFIGLNAAGNAPLPNQSDGVRITDGFMNTIGGIGADVSNSIAFNGRSGVLLLAGTGNSIYENSIFSNAGLGIDLTPTGVTGPNGVTANDVGDADPGANNLQNFPLLTSVISNGGGTTIQGNLNSTPNTIFQIDFYSNAACDPSGNGEGARFFGTTNLTTDANGNATINLASSTPLPSGRVITATAKDPAGNTSEFSPCDSTNAIGNLQFSLATYNVLEDVGAAVITVIRQGGSSGALTVNYNTADGTATAGSDYTAVSGTLVFGDGEVSKTISIPIADDGVTEPAETLRVNLSATGVETIGSQGAATLTIQDKRTPLVLTMNNVDVLEGDSGSTNAVVTVNLSAATGRTVTVDFNTIGASATSGEDFTAVTGSLTFAPGVITQPIMIPIIGDTLQEANETFQVVLSNPTNASVGNSSLVRIVNDPPNAVDDTLSSVAEDSGMRTIPIASLLSNDTNGQANGSAAGLAFSLIAASEFGGTVSSDAANVYFTPAANFNGQASFPYRLSESGAITPENDTATVRFTITEVADTPSVTNATTYVNTQTTSGLVITRNLADSGAITHFKITNILNGTLFKSNGSTPINPNDFITSFEGNAGVKFTPATDLTSPGSTFSFDVQASTSNSDAGLGVGVATATITVNPTVMFIVNTLGDVPDPALNGVCDSDTGMAGDQCTLRAAIQETNNSPGPDIIGFDPALNGTTITLNSALDAINSKVSVNGPGANLLTVRRSDVAATRFRIFTVNFGKTVSISGLTISNGRTIDATISNPSGNGGGILNEGTLNLDSVAVSDNRAGNGFQSSNGGYGGGIYSTGSLAMTNSSVVGNKAGTGDTNFGGNGGFGGGIYSSGPLTLTNSLVNGNQTGAGSDITHATGSGGGIYCVGILTLTDSTVSDNQTPGGASAGGGAGISAGTLTLTNSRVINNTAASGNGGGISSGGSTTTLTNSVVSGNHANGGYGGGISSSGTLKVVSSAITDNTSAYGGGLNFQGSNPATVVNSTISGNSSLLFGGGLYYSASIALTNVTVTNNRCDSDNSGNEQGGGIYRSFGSLTLNNTIVAGNFRGSSPGTTADDISGATDASSSFNLIGTGGSGGLTNGINSNQVGVIDARLGPLANNGGSTQTHALLTGSPALDAGNNAFVTDPPFTGPPFTDQRGGSFNRIADGDGNSTAIVDIGAYEQQGILTLDKVNPAAGRTTGGQQIILVGAFANLSTVTMGGASASWFYTNGSLDTSAITVTTPAHAVGAVQIDLTPTSGSPYSKANAFAYLPTVFTDNTIMVGQTTAKGQHIIELRQAIDALRAVAGLSPAPWTAATLTPSSSIIKAIHILELRSYLDDAAGRLGYATAPYTDPSLTSGFTVKRIHIEELRQRIRTIAG